MRIEPTIGRIVWYWPRRDEHSNLAEGVEVYTAEQPFVATICHISEGGNIINIAGFDHIGHPFARRGVPLYQEGDSVPTSGGYCEWMPYQVGQAKKHAGEDAKGPVAVDVSSKVYREGYEAGHEDGRAGRLKRNRSLSFEVGGYGFGDALTAAVDGARIYREGWRGRKAGLDQFVVYMSRLQLPSFNTQGTEKKVNDRTAKWIGADAPLDCQPYFAMHSGGGNWQPGWLASQADMLARDWVIVPEVTEAPAA